MQLLLVYVYVLFVYIFVMSKVYVAFFFFFFFQAEDGIRDYKVTGVQTCALPIYLARQLEKRRLLVGALERGEPVDGQVDAVEGVDEVDVPPVAAELAVGDRLERSEEHTSELQSPCNLVCRLLLEKKKKK